MPDSPMGGDISRVDGPLKVTGAAKYSSDHNFPGLVYGHAVVSTTGNAAIRAMDVSGALSAHGVLAVYTPFDTLKLLPGPGPLGQMWLPLQDREVGHQGQIIGLVVAESLEQARDAAAKVQVDYEHRPVAASFEAGVATAETPEVWDFQPAVLDFLADGVESIEQAVAASEHIFSASYTTPFQGHAAMEPHSAVARWEDGTLTVYTGNQGVGLVVADLAAALGLDESRIHGISPFTGGSFGGKFFTGAHTYLAAAAARALGRPVKVVLTREQVFSGTMLRSATAQRIWLGAESDGRLTALRHDSWSSRSPLVDLPGGEAAAHRTSRSWYAADNIGIRHRVMTLNTAPTSIMRAPGEATGSFALETAFDELAVQLGIDPIELRMKNYATIFQGRGVPWSSKHLDECYAVGAQRFGWDRRNPEPGSVVDGDWLVGMGMATAIHPTYRRSASMTVRLRPDDVAEVSGSAADIGTGMWTVVAIVGADALGIPLERVAARIGDSTLAPAGFVGGSTGTASVSPAIMAAADAVKRELIDLAITQPASPLHGLRAEDVGYGEGRLTAGGRTLGFGELLRTVRSPGISAVGSAGPGDEADDYAFCSFGAQFCEVRVNRWTAETRVSRLLSVMDVGRVVNRKTTRGQIIGGVVWGVSAALHEGLHIEESGRLANGNLAEYLVPVNADIPAIDVHLLDHPDLNHNPAGVRGAGEIGIVGVAAAVGNAVYNATGKRIRDLPITIEKLL
ncbi:xanthine dehydrogenase family protein molybdopterin-binding subunit [Saccharopolyspora sp. 5N708]|uniref:xanthine dehydrogenase family protein molybdopterin-binding subunit n=1 Tax=Saccharopolyspora sp. 5N708 TaxID=3457424 RepID=UPI003FD36D60